MYKRQCHERIAVSLLAENHVEEARGHVQTCLKVTRQLAARDASNAESVRDLALALELEADLRVADGDTGAALAALEQALERMTAVIRLDPTHVQLKHDVASIHRRMAEMLEQQGRKSEARAHEAAADSLEHAEEAS